MANLTETPNWEAGIYQLETTDEVLGGPDGKSNLQPKQLANRTAYLKQQVEGVGTASAAHAARTDNPHGVTKAQVGLGSVENYGVASQAEAEAGSSNTKYMTALRVAEAIAAQVVAATEAIAGRLRIATQAETDAGAADDRVVTPKKLRWGFSISLGVTGYIALPSWLGGVIFQWGTVTGLSSATKTVTLPIACPNACVQVLATMNGGPSGVVQTQVFTVTNFGINLSTAFPGSNAQASWFAITY